jgi:hypothetical protein
MADFRWVIPRRVVVERSTERNAATGGVFGFPIQLDNKPLQVLPDSFLGFIDGRVERLYFGFLTDPSMTYSRNS